MYSLTKLYISNWGLTLYIYFLKIVPEIFNFCRTMRNQSLNKMMLSVFRKRMVWLWLAGMSAREISCCTGASVSTVYRWVRRWQAGSSLEAKDSRGRQPERMMVEEYFSHEIPWYLQGVAAAAVSSEIFQHRSCHAEVLCTRCFVTLCFSVPVTPHISLL